MASLMLELTIESKNFLTETGVDGQTDGQTDGHRQTVKQTDSSAPSLYSRIPAQPLDCGGVPERTHTHRHEERAHFTHTGLK